MLINSIRLKEGHEPTPNVQLLDTADIPLDIKQLAVKVVVKKLEQGIIEETRKLPPDGMYG